jgi:putative membrane protein
MPSTIVNHVSEADHRLVTAAVAAAEQHTNGEIVTIVTDLSDDYHDVALVLASVIALMALAVIAAMPAFHSGLLDWATDGWRHEYGAHAYLWLLVLLVALSGIGSYLLLLWMPLRLALTPRSIRAMRVRRRAVDLFRVSTDAKTVGRTGILLYLSMREHRAEIVADRAIASKVTPDVWGEAMAALISEVRAGEPGKGMAEAVRLMSVVLAEHFPKGSDNPNELPDRLIEL